MLWKPPPDDFDNQYSPHKLQVQIQWCTDPSHSNHKKYNSPPKGHIDYSVIFHTHHHSNKNQMTVSNLPRIQTKGQTRRKSKQGFLKLHRFSEGRRPHQDPWDSENQGMSPSTLPKQGMNATMN